jgi:hypothetical protein
VASYAAVPVAFRRCNTFPWHEADPADCPLCGGTGLRATSWSVMLLPDGREVGEPYTVQGYAEAVARGLNAQL